MCYKYQSLYNSSIILPSLHVPNENLFFLANSRQIEQTVHPGRMETADDKSSSQNMVYSEIEMSVRNREEGSSCEGDVVSILKLRDLFFHSREPILF